MFPCAHPYGTGSVNAEAPSTQPARVCRNRLLSLQSFFRRSSRYAFWELDMTIKRHLFFFNLHRVRCNLKSGASSEDKFTQTFGTIIPRRIPESSSWWRVLFCFVFVPAFFVRPGARRVEAQSRDLAAISDDAEQGPILCSQSRTLLPRVRVIRCDGVLHELSAACRSLFRFACPSMFMPFCLPR